MKIVLKFSGKNIDPDKDCFLEPVAELWGKGAKIALVHGGGPQITGFMEKMGRKPVFVDGLRMTGEEDMTITEMVLSGLLNKTLVGLLHRYGVAACGISGRDASLFLAQKHLVKKDGQEIDIGRVGDIRQVNSRLVETLWNGGILPVISPVSTDDQGRSLNVNADWAAARLAVSLQADKLLLFTDVPGVLADPTDPTSLIENLRVVDIQTLIQQGIVSGGMIPKLQMIQDVLKSGVSEVFIAGGSSLGLLGQLLEGKSIPGTRVII
jgi:acetylglutamate kinase